MRKLFLIIFLVSYHLVNAQLVDPFGKIITHEIKLTKLANGSFTGAIEWVTAPKDSLQRFVINGLDINAPVMVRVISKAPKHNIDLSFHKSDWDKIESKISTDGKKFASKIFRTTHSAGVGVSSEVAGIPYLLIVKVGLKFPVTKSLVRITDDKEEYAKHLKKMGIANDSFDKNSNSSTNKSDTTIEHSSNNNSTLLYILIGLLTVIIILLTLFLVKRKNSKDIALLFFLFASTQFCVAQIEGPVMVPISGQGDAPVFHEYQTQNVENQVPVDYNSPGLTPAHDRVANVDVPVPGGDGTFRSNTIVRLNPNQGSIELPPSETEEIQRRMQEDSKEFDSNYIDNMPGKTTHDGQRIPEGFNRDELNRLKRQVRDLRRQVELLSQEDEEYDADANSDLNEDSESNGSQGENAEILIYCEDIPACISCLDQSMIKLSSRIAKFRVLQKFYSSEIKEINRKISFGNAYSQIHPISAIVWQNSLSKDIMPAVMNLRRVYNKKYDEYLASLEAELNFINECPANTGTDGIKSKAVRDQVEAILFHYRSTRILD